MTTESVTYSIAKLGRHHFWVAEKDDSFYAGDVPAIAEGTSATKEEAVAAVRKVLAELGIENATAVFSYYAKCYKKRRHALQAPRAPQTAKFQGRDYLWQNIAFFSDQTGEYVSYWEKRSVLRVTEKFIFVQDGNEGVRRLDRAALERDGRVSSRNHADSFCTEAGYKAAL